MMDLWEAVKWLLYGFVAGYFFVPAVTMLRRVYEEFRLDYNPGPARKYENGGGADGEIDGH